MRTQISKEGVCLWLSARDTTRWANGALGGGRWPSSALAGKRLFAAFDSNGLLELTVNGRDCDVDVSEFNAVTSDYLARKLPPDHPAYFANVGQFKR